VHRRLSQIRADDDRAVSHVSQGKRQVGGHRRLSLRGHRTGHDNGLQRSIEADVLQIGP